MMASSHMNGRYLTVSQTVPSRILLLLTLWRFSPLYGGQLAWHALPLDSKGPKVLHIKALFAFCLVQFKRSWRDYIGRNSLSPPPSKVTHKPLVGQGLLIIGGFTITLRCTTVRRTPLDKSLAWGRELFLTTYTHPCPWQYSNLQSWQVEARRPTP
jgi:hypothetical protein